MSRRRLARPGLTYWDANLGRMVTESAELLDMKARIKACWPDLDIGFDAHDQVFVVVQKCEDGVERFVLQRPYCDERLMMDIAKTDPSNRNYIDPEKSIDDHNEKLERDRERKLEEIAGDFGERLVHALKKDGYMDHEDIFGARAKPQSLRDRAIR